MYLNIKNNPFAKKAAVDTNDSSNESLIVEPLLSVSDMSKKVENNLVLPLLYCDMDEIPPSNVETGIVFKLSSMGPLSCCVNIGLSERKPYYIWVKEIVCDDLTTTR